MEVDVQDPLHLVLACLLGAPDEPGPGVVDEDVDPSGLGDDAGDALLDETVLSGVFLTVAPVAVAYLAYSTKRSFSETAFSLIDCVTHYEERNSKEEVAPT